MSIPTTFSIIGGIMSAAASGSGGGTGGGTPTFDPDGGATSGSRVTLSDSGGTFRADVVVTCTQPAVWTYVKGTSIPANAGAVNVSNGGTATSIRFTLVAGPQPREVDWTLDATSGSVTRYWNIALDTDENTCPTCCFTPGTMIRMGDMSLKPIEQIKVGDFILVYDEQMKSNVAVPVTEVITRENRPMYEITFEDGNKLNASEDHPLYVVGKGYASVTPTPDYKDLERIPNMLMVGDQVVNELGVPARITKIESIEYCGTVYTFGNSRFYANGVLVY